MTEVIKSIARNKIARTNVNILNYSQPKYLNLDSEPELLKVMKDIDGRGHSILYPASQSGKQKVLNLIMKQNYWPDFLKQEKEITEEWESFVCNVCATGCKELAKTIFEQNLDLLEPKDGNVTPLMR